MVLGRKTFEGLAAPGSARASVVDAVPLRRTVAALPTGDRRNSTPVGEPRDLVARGYLLHGPSVTVRIIEEDERSPRENLHLTYVDPSLDKLSPSRVDV